MSQPSDPSGSIPPGSPAPIPPSPDSAPGQRTIPPIDYASLPGPFNFADFLTFKTMIAIPVIMVLFWIGVAYVAILGIAVMFKGGMAGVCVGFGIILIGPFLVRIQCEFLIVVFRINETLSEIQKDLRKRP